MTAGDVAYSLARRSAFERRAVVLGGDREELLEGVGALAEGEPAGNLIEGPPLAREQRVAFVFPGQGGQWAGMAVELLDDAPVFARLLGECGEALAAWVDWSLEDVLCGVAGAPLLERVDVVQPALWAVMVSLAGLWRACGVRPDAVVGHSQGEIAAACVAGGLTLEDGARVVALRSRALASLAGHGGMASVALGAEELRSRFGDLGEGVSVAAVNGPGSIVVSGDPGALDRLVERCVAAGVRARRIAVDYAAHSAQVEEIREELLNACAGIAPRSGDVPFHSSVTGGVLDTAELDAGYWYRNLRETVRFEQATAGLLEEGYRTFIEASPHPVLTVAVHETAEAGRAGGNAGAADGGGGEGGADLPGSGSAMSGGVAALGSLRRDEGGARRLLTSLGEAWVRGVPVDWGAAIGDAGRSFVRLPTYAFQRQRFWAESAGGVGDIAAIGQSAAEHPLLGAMVALADDRGWVFTGRLSLRSAPWLADHMVLGTVLVPGTALLELALYAGMRAGCGVVRELTLQTPLVLSEQEGVQIQVVVGELEESVPVSPPARPLSIYARREAVDGEEQPWVLHASGALSTEELLADASSALTGEWPPPGAQPLELDGAYERLADAGLEYGPAFQGLRSAWRQGERLFAEIELPEEERARAGLFLMHPALLDAALHPAGLAAVDEHAQGASGEAGAGGGVRLPFSWSGVALHAVGASALRVSLVLAGDDAVSLSAVDEGGAPVLAVERLVVRPLPAGRLDGGLGANRESLFGLEWVTAPVPPHVASVEGGPAEEWAIVGGEQGWLAGGLRGADVPCGGAYESFDALRDAVRGGAPTPDVVLVDCVGASGGPSAGDLPTEDPPAEDATGYVPVEDVPTGDLPTVAQGVVGWVLGVVQGWLEDERFGDSRLVVVTRDAVAVHGREAVAGLAQSAVWGLVRSAQWENPGRLVLVDVDGQPASWEVLGAALAGVDRAEIAQQIGVREGEAFVPRLARAGAGGVLTPPAESAKEWRLDVVGRGTLENLALVESPEAGRPLEPGEVRVAVRAAGVNFRDVLIALDMYPDPTNQARIGGEGAGVVVEVGAGVEDLARGDRVMGLLGAFGPAGVADRRLLARVPKGWSFEQAASVPVVFLTALYALHDLAGLRAGERLLVHAATGGVGMAAVQLARHLGVEVFATASPGKWPALAGMGFDEAHIASSRTAEFRERFLEATGGAGVDVVLDCLAGELIDASLDLLPRGGRFVEMGKTDVRDAGEVATAHPDVAYRAFDMLEAGPQRIEQMLGELTALFERGALQPLPVTAWDVRRAPEAFRFLSQARHTGKVVLNMPRAVDPDSTVLITGGTGGLGALLATHLVGEHGVRSVLLAGRRGPDAEGAGELRACLEELGALVRIEACDVADRAQLAALLERVPARFPLGAVVHAAGVLDDGTIGSLSAERVERVLAPKLAGAWHLHELTEHLDLWAFAMFSSAAGTFGSPGQGSYAAANVFLDALASHRRERGLAGLSIAWGLWAQASAMTGHLGSADLERMERMGVSALSNEEGLRLFDGAREAGRALVVAAPLSGSMLRARARTGLLPALLGGLVSTTMPMRRAGESGGLARRLAGVPESERAGVVREAVRAQVALVLGHASPQAVDVQRNFLELGFDSLTAVELRNRLAQATGLQLPVTLVFDRPTPAELADLLCAKLAHVPGSGNGRAATADGSAVGPPIAGESIDTFSSLLPQAIALGEVDGFLEMVVSAARFRSTFDAPLGPGEAQPPIRLSEGPIGASAIYCLPSLLATAGPHQYARFARACRGVREVSALSVPGFLRGERVPASFQVAVETQAERVRRAVGDGAPLVLLGHSTGGTLAYAVAAHLQEAGTGPAAVVLIDTYWGGALTEMTTHAIGGMLEQRGTQVPMSDAALTAMIVYGRLLGEWEPVGIAAPTLLVRATEPAVANLPEEGWQASVSVPHTAVDVPGNHFTTMEEHAETTAQAVREWLALLP